MSETQRRLFKELRHALLLLGTATSVRDRLKMGQYLCRGGVDRLLRRSPPPGRENCVRFREVQFVFREFNAELTGYLEIFQDKIYEQVEAFVPQEGWTVFDVGANLGMFSIRQSSRIGRTGHIYAFEPNQEVASRLQRNLSLNKVENATMLEGAVGERTETRFFEVNPRSGCGGKLKQQGTESKCDKVAVKTFSLDDFCNERTVDRIDLLKVDVEGAEVEVLSGGAKALQLTERIMLEYHSPKLKAQTTDILTNSGFDMVHDHVTEQISYWKKCA